ncbi:hypothetical protein OSB04_015222 [Centaurea solstitialis]|uniref:F-box domain-containing protein n=1 Tax=Centaurea solstitialis TaxID=347529 RepID=A0AA38W8Q9_9ASTR|nr:hypothetical protein OSB04_015222 [Centaurea solstitialis]
MSTQIPFDIQFLIIERLPIKSLLRFRSVCKAWKSFISSSDFIAFHHAHSQQHLIISYENLDDQLINYVSLLDDDQTAALTVPPLVQGKRVVNSSHGLLCMVNSFDRFSETQMAVIWNPAIKKSIAVAVPNMVDHQEFPFDYVVGFGVCPATMDPKLLKITFISNPLEIQSISCIPFQVMVFTLSSGKWTTLPSTTNLPRKSIQFEGSPTVIGQFIYLFGFDWRAFYGKSRNLIMSFDLTTHEFREVDIPNSLHGSYLSVSRLRESLVLLEYNSNLIDDKHVIHVWMMDDGDSKAFTKLFTINPLNAYVWGTMGFRESGELIIEWTHAAVDRTSALAIYELGLGHIMDLGIRGNKDSFYGSCYMESLLLLDHEDGRIIRFCYFHLSVIKSTVIMSTQMLPFEIQFLIIERLPMKSLLRFRSVCKPWKSFISSSKFIAFRHAQSQQHLIISYKNLDDQLQCVSLFDDDDHQTFVLTVPPLVQGTRVLDSSHGLVCMIDSFSLLSQTQMAVLWNPAIRKSMAVAVPNVVDPPPQQFQFRSVVAFGVCPATMDPKLVKITCVDDQTKAASISFIPFQVMVFTLSSGQWTTQSTNLPSKSIVFDNGCQTVLGQFIYFVGYDCSAFDGELRTLVMSFDLSTHEFGEVDIPNCLRDSFMSVFRLRESLVLLDIGPDRNNEKFHVWMMMDDGDSKGFTKLFTIDPPDTYVSETLGFRESGEPVIEIYEMHRTSALSVYEPGSGDIMKLGICGKYDSFYASSYTESLLLLDHEDGRIIRC